MRWRFPTLKFERFTADTIQMLAIQLGLFSGNNKLTLTGAIWNVSALAARSDYEFEFEGRTLDDARLEKYPRWCESVEGLVARCLALSTSGGIFILPRDWTRLAVDIGLRPGGRGYELLSSTRVSLAARGLDVLCAAVDGPARRLDGIAPRANYGDLWDLAEHALRLATFGCDDLPATRELDVPVRWDAGLSFVCMGDIPEPARSAFEKRMAGSGRPVIEDYPDAVNSWDWLDFLGAR